VAPVVVVQVTQTFQVMKLERQELPVKVLLEERVMEPPV
jgi:hypothetical protein